MASAEEEPLSRLVQQVEPNSNITQETRPDSRNTTQETSPDSRNTTQETSPDSRNTAQDTSQSPAAPATLKDFQDLHDKTHAAVQKGLNADEEGDITAAQHHYTSSLPLLEQILTTNCESWVGVSTTDKDTARIMKRKMSKTKLQVTSRLESLRQPPSPNTLYPRAGDAEDVRLPSYEEAISSGPSSPVSETGAGGRSSLPSGRHLSTQGTELFSIADGVQIFHITCDGYVTAPSYPTSLHVIRFQELGEALEGEGGGESGAEGADRVFLQVGDWLYPLLPGTSPILHTSYGAYLFPDLSPDGTGSSVGLMLPGTASEEELFLLEDILRNFAVIQNHQARETPTGEEEQAEASAPWTEAPGKADKGAGAEVTEEEVEVKEPGRRRIADHSTSAIISRGILTASSWLSWGLEKGAEKAGHWINYGSTRLRGKLQPEQRPRPVDSRIQKGARYARQATHTAVSVSAYVVTKLGEATMALGRQVAPHLRKKGGELLPNSVKTKDNKSRLRGVVHVASSGLRGLGTVWLSLERAAKALGRSIATETVATVQHKYGEEAGKVAEDTVYAAGNVAMTAYTAESLAAKAIIRRTAKDAGTAVVQELQDSDDTTTTTETQQQQQQQQQTGEEGGAREEEVVRSQDEDTATATATAAAADDEDDEKENSEEKSEKKQQQQMGKEGGAREEVLVRSRDEDTAATATAADEDEKGNSKEKKEKKQQQPPV